MQTAVSIIIINYNTFQLTCNCIESVLLHTTGLSYEIILVDNASTESEADLFKQKFPSIHLIKSETNLGFAGGNNLGLQYATGEYILLLNSDTLLTENSILFIYEKAKAIPALGAATVKLVYPDGSIQPAARSFPSVKKHFLEFTRLYRLFHSTYDKLAERFDYNTDFSCDWIWGTFFFFPRKNLELTGGKLAATYFMYSEDVEWCYLFSKQGLVNYYFSGSSVIHLIGKSSGDKYKRSLVRKNHLHFIRTCYGLLPYLLEWVLCKGDDLEQRLRKTA